MTARSTSRRAALFIVCALWAVHSRAPGQLSPAPADGAGVAIRDVAVDSLPLAPERREEILAAVRASDLASAEALLAAEHERVPQSVEILRTLAAVSFQAGNYWNAAIALKRAEKLAPLDSAGRFLLSMAYVVLERPDWARPELERLHESAPDNPVFLFWLARLDYDDQRFTDAAGKLERVISLDPGFVRAHDRLGLCFEALGDYQKAEERFRIAVKLNRSSDSPSPWPALNLGTMLSRQGRDKQAEAHLRESVLHGARLAKAHYELGVLLERKADLAGALEHLVKAAELDPAAAGVQYALGRAYRRDGRLAEAGEAMRRFRELKAKEADVAPSLPAPE